MQILAAILTSEPVLPEDVPTELARIIRRGNRGDRRDAAVESHILAS